MAIIQCNYCKTNTFYSDRKYKKYNSNLHINVCKSCEQNIKFYNKGYCLKHLYLTHNELNNIKYLFHPERSEKLYSEADINSIILRKYRSKENADLINNNKKIKQQMQKQKKINLVEERRKNLIKLLSDYKLEYNEIGLVYSHVQYGAPSENVVLEDLLFKTDIKNTKKYEFYQEIQKLNIPFDEGNHYYQEYMKNNMTLHTALNNIYKNKATNHDINNFDKIIVEFD